MFEELLSEIEQERKRVASAGLVETKKELSANVYPLLAQVVETIATRLAETEDVVAAYLEGEDSMIRPELGGQIIGVFEAAAQMCNALLADPAFAIMHTGAQQLLLLINETTDVVETSILEDDDDEDEDDEEDEEELEAQ